MFRRSEKQEELGKDECLWKEGRIAAILYDGLKSGRNDGVEWMKEWRKTGIKRLFIMAELHIV